MSKISDISDLIEVSRLAGEDILLVQGTGGNTSVKSADGSRMWIKASGLRLSEVRDGHGYVEIDLQALLAVLRDQRLSSLPRVEAQEEMTHRTQAATRGAGSLRPSLETGFHASLDRVAVHTHPVYVNAFACMQSGEDALAGATSEPFAWARYEPPGYSLAVQIDNASTAFKRDNGHPPAQIVLASHGLITTSATATGAIAETLRLVDVARCYFGQMPPDSLEAERPSGPLVKWAEDLEAALKKRSSAPDIIARASTQAALLSAASEPDKWLTGGPLIPDDVVYGTHQVRKVEPRQSPQAWLDREIEALPARMVVVVPGLGVILVAPHLRVLDIMEEYLLAHVLTRRLIARRGHPRVLPPVEVQYLEEMESEAYRLRVASTGAPEAD